MVTGQFSVAYVHNQKKVAEVKRRVMGGWWRDGFLKLSFRGIRRLHEMEGCKLAVRAG